jgi:hypothetical protein
MNVFYSTQQQTEIVIRKERTPLRGVVTLFVKSFKINALGGLFDCGHSSQESLFQKVFSLESIYEE